MITGITSLGTGGLLPISQFQGMSLWLDNLAGFDQHAASCADGVSGKACLRAGGFNRTLRFLRMALGGNHFALLQEQAAVRAVYVTSLASRSSVLGWAKSMGTVSS